MSHASLWLVGWGQGWSSRWVSSNLNTPSDRSASCCLGCKNNDSLCWAVDAHTQCVCCNGNLRSCAVIEEFKCFCVVRWPVELIVHPNAFSVVWKTKWLSDVPEIAGNSKSQGYSGTEDDYFLAISEDPIKFGEVDTLQHIPKDDLNVRTCIWTLNKIIFSWM